jgi:hypothetical protein
MRAILPGKLKLITQGANAFRSRMTGVDGAKVFVDPFCQEKTDRGKTTLLVSKLEALNGLAD